MARGHPRPAARAAVISVDEVVAAHVRDFAIDHRQLAMVPQIHPRQLPALPTEPEQSLIEGLLHPRGLEASAPKADVLPMPEKKKA